MKTIVALSTNIENSAIALIRLSGDLCISLTKKIANSKLIENRVLSKIYIKNRFIDEVIINTFNKPSSFTGEDMVEISTHANSIIVNEIIDFYIQNGCVYAKSGEFLERAFLNNKITFEKAQIINEIIKSKNKMVLNMYRKSYENDKNVNSIRRIRNTLGNLIMKSDMSIEYPEYETHVLNSKEEIISLIKAIKKQIKQISLIEKLNKGIKIAIIGKVNSGKSSLFNYLLKKERAIVTNIPGTTTDYIEDWLVWDDKIRVTLIDTAGWRETKKLIEKKGIDKSLSIIKTVDIIIWLEENMKAFDKKLITKAHVLKVLSKKDTLEQSKNSILSISTKNKINVNKLIDNLRKIIKSIIINFDISELAFVSNLNSFLTIEKELTIVLDGLKNGLTIDIFRSNLNNCLDIMNTILGETKTYIYIEQIFRSFCIGK